MEIIKFTLFADFHYKKGMYISPVSDMSEIISSAVASGSDFVLHAGDMCNDYKGSPELISAYLGNPEGMAVYGVYGNHELESTDNSMNRVTPLLTNRPVVFGTADGETGDGSVAYYYFDKGKFRFICLDTNYSYSEERGVWEHNTERSYGAPKGNLYPDSLGPEQLEWLHLVLDATRAEKKHAILVSHAAFGGDAPKLSPDASSVRRLIALVNKEAPRTVIMAINGHYHTNHLTVSDGVVYLDTNTTRNGYWSSKAVPHYNDECFTFVDYDAEGTELSRIERPVNKLRMSANTWYFASPLYTVVTISTDGVIAVDGMEVGWLFGVDPNPDFFADPRITGGVLNF